MSDDRFFALVAGLCILFWLLARERRLDPRLRRWLQVGAFGVLAGGMIWAAFQSLAWFLAG